MSEHSERLVRIETKLDDLINLRLEDRMTQTQKCQGHLEMVCAMQKTVDEHDAIKNRVIGAGKIVAWASGSGALLGTIIGVLARIIKHKTGNP